MLMLVSYDVSTLDRAGQRRLRRVAKACTNCGVRVQKSVFECVLEPAQWEKLKANLIELIDPETDSLRFYHLGKDGRRKVEHYGANSTPDVENDTLLL